MMSSLAASRIITFPAPPILDLKKHTEEHKEQQHAPSHPPAVLPQLPITSARTPAASSPSSPTAVLSLPLPSEPPAAETKTADVAEAVWAVEEEEEVAAPVVPTRKFGLSLRLSNAETIEDEHAADIQVEGAEPITPAVGFRLKLTVAGADDDNTPQIATSKNIHDDGAALENKWQLKVKEADVDLKRASFEVTAEGVLKTKAFAIGKSGFRRTSDIDLATPSAAAASYNSPHLPTPLASTTAANHSSSTPLSHNNSTSTPHDPAAANSPSSPTPSRPHLDISDDTILEMGLLGRGAGGKVLKSLHKPSLTVVALKCIDVSDKNKRAQLLKELKELDTEYSAHIVAFYGAYYKDITCTVQLGLEYMNRGSLQHVVHEHGALHELALSHIVKQSLLGLYHLHTHRKLHRDIKPGNILANHFGIAKLSDFGIIAELSNSMAKCGTFVGTTIYMSPERLTSEAYSYPADVWSLGMTIITMATGSFPLSTDDGYWGLVMHFNTQPSPNLPDTFSASFRDFVSRCLMKEPAKRWAVKELLEHPWILNGCEAEEALTYWPEGARMHQPDPELVRKQKEERLEKLRRWEEGEEKKKARAALKHKRKQSMGVAPTEEAAIVASAAAEAGSESGKHSGSEEDEDSARVRHRRKQAITRFHPVGLLHLQAEAHVQSSEKQTTKSTAGDLYGDGSDDDEEEHGGDGSSGQTSQPVKQQLNPLTARSKRAVAASAPPAAAVAQPSNATPTATAGRVRGASAGKGAADAFTAPPNAQKDEKTESRAGSLARPTASSSSPLRQPVTAAVPAPDFNLVSPTRAARQNVKFVNGQMLAVGLPLAKQQSAPAQLMSPNSAQSGADGAAFSFPAIGASPSSPDLPATASIAAAAALPSSPLLPAITALPSIAAVSHPSTSTVASPSASALSPPEGTVIAVARPKSLAPLRVESGVIGRDRSASTGDTPTSSTAAVDSISPLPIQARGTPKLHRRYPSVPAASLVLSPVASVTSPVLAANASPTSPALSALSPLSPDFTPLSPSPLSPLPPTSDMQQRRGGLRRRPSVANADNSPAVPSSRSAMRLPALPNAAQPESEEVDRDRAASTQPLSGEVHGERGLRTYRSSISAAFTTYDLPPVTPAHFRSISSLTPHSPLTPQPLSPRSTRMMSIISASEIDDLYTILRTLINLYRDREQKENNNSVAVQPNDSKSVLSAVNAATAPTDRTAGRKNSLPAYMSRSQSISATGSSDSLDSPSSSSPSSSGSSGVSGMGAGGVGGYGWSWLPDDRGVREDLERIADQLGIWLSVVMHVFRKLLY